jgi:transposase InsO family protein
VKNLNNTELNLNDNKRWITTNEAAECMEITPRAARQKAENGELGEIKEISGRGGRAGINILIRPENLPAAAYLRYYAKHNQPPQIKELGIEWDQATEKQKEKAVAAHQRLTAWLDYRKNHPASKGEADQEFIAAWRQLHPEDKVSRPTHYLDLEKFKQGGLGALVPQHGLHRRGTEIIDPDAKATFLSIYLDSAQPSISHCIELVQTINIIQNKNWSLPSSKRTFERIVASLDEATKTLMREGKTALNNKHGAHLIRNYDDLEVMQIWQCDHQEQDFFVRGPHGEIARPWQTVWMDARSRMVVGWHCSMGGNTDTIMAGFADSSLSLGGLIPAHWVIDNGRDFTGKRLTNGCKKFRKIDESTVKALTQHLGITVHYCIPENPQAKHIERCFRTLREYFDKYQPSYTGNEPKKRPETAEEARKTGQVMSWDQFVQASKDAWLYYNTRPHSGEGMNGKAPMEVFNEGLQQIQARRVKPDALKFLMWRTSEPRMVRGGGIQIDGSFYRSSELLDYEGKKVHARFSPNCKTVFIFNEKDVKLCEAELVETSAWLDQEKTKDGMAVKNAFKKQVRQKVAAIRRAADPVAHDKKTLFGLQTEMAKRRAAVIKKTVPTVIEPVRTPFDQIAKEVAATADKHQPQVDLMDQYFQRQSHRIAVGETSRNIQQNLEEIQEGFAMLEKGLRKLNGGK